WWCRRPAPAPTPARGKGTGGGRSCKKPFGWPSGQQVGEELFVAHEALKRSRIKGRRKIIALEMGAAMAAQPAIFARPVHPFGQHADAEPFAQSEDRAADRLAVRPAIDVGDELAVDLDLVEGNGAQRAEARIADAEIVEGHADAELAEVLEEPVAALRVAG